MAKSEWTLFRKVANSDKSLIDDNWINYNVKTLDGKRFNIAYSLNGSRFPESLDLIRLEKYEFGNQVINAIKRDVAINSSN